ncbi:probable chitinase 10 [Malaya genurostris]|uniref:probable chitinase 10 n=1 Tax=Malaya genurostris TaxID=325434 RepID=UPI0026F3E221|nr:probable chitinase 10 [Malaya genurostris]
MKQYVSILLTLAVASGYCLDNSHYCPELNDPVEVHLYPHPTDCSKFLMCNWGKLVVKDCPPRLLWNDAKKYCDWSWNVECGQSSSSTANPNPESSSATANPNPGSSSATSNPNPGSSTATANPNPGSSSVTSNPNPGSSSATANPNPGSSSATANPNPGSSSATSNPNPGSSSATANPNPGSSSATANPNPGSSSATSNPNPGSSSATANPNPGSSSTTSNPGAGSTDDCPEEYNPDHQVYFEHQDPTKYYICTYEGSKLEQQCLPGLLWDQRKGYCHDLVPDPDCPSVYDPDKQVYFPHPDPTKYYICTYEGAKRERQCSPGLHWNQTRGYCHA